MATPRRRVSSLRWTLMVLLATFVPAACSSLHPPVSTEESSEPAPPASQTAATDTTATEEPTPIRVKISDEERAKLVAQYDSDLAAAIARAASRPVPTELSADDRQRWDTLDQYIELAKASLDAGEVRAAADLALKARLLADELAPR